jgi:single-strand DNA-binding protein
MKIGVRIKLDVTKINKELLFKGNKGVYLDATAFIDIDNQGQYGDNGMVTQDTKQGEPDGDILGNVKVFWKDEAQQQAHQPRQAPPKFKPNADPNIDFDDDIPFAPIALQYPKLIHVI